eukprot:12322719-Alexandrium_andersonii.AAC.1
MVEGVPRARKYTDSPAATEFHREYLPQMAIALAATQGLLTAREVLVTKSLLEMWKSCST